MGRKFLIIDDSALMRRVISDIIKKYSEYEVLDVATNGLEGFDKLVSNPRYYTLVILDINMPKMNGLEMLERLQKNHMKENVVVVSTVAKEGAAETIRALELGALDFMTKPENFFEVKGEDFKDHLLALIDAVSGSAKSAQATKTAPASKSLAKNLTATQTAVKPVSKPAVSVNTPLAKGNKIVALACSTGGPKSLQSVIPLLPENLDAPVVMVQHMPKGFTKSLAQRLDSLSKVKVKEAEDGDILMKGHVYIAPGGMHIRVVKSGNGHIIKYDDRPALDGLRPCANVMYESLIDAGYEHYTCVVLTGMGADGTKGIKSLKDAGKNMYVIGQDAESCVVYGMPRTLHEAGLTNEVQPLDKIAESIIKNVGVH